MSRIFSASNPLVPAAPEPAPVGVDEWQVKMLAALDQLAAAVLDRPVPVVEIPPVDLGGIVQAVTSLKGPATAEEIAEALAGVLRRDEPEDDDSTNATLAEVADALRKLEFRLQGVGTQAYGGGSVSFSPQALNQLTDALGVVSGTWGYEAGANGTVALSGGKRVLAITAASIGGAGSFTINGGDAISLPYDATANPSSSLTVTPAGNLVDPEIVFDGGVDAFFVEFVV